MLGPGFWRPFFGTRWRQGRGSFEGRDGLRLSGARIRLMFGNGGPTVYRLRSMTSQVNNYDLTVGHPGKDSVGIGPADQFSFAELPRQRKALTRVGLSEEWGGIDAGRRAGGPVRLAEKARQKTEVILVCFFRRMVRVPAKKSAHRVSMAGMVRAGLRGFLDFFA